MTKKIIYAYVLDTMTDWELSYILSAINISLLQNKLQKQYTIKAVGNK